MTAPERHPPDHLWQLYKDRTIAQVVRRISSGDRKVAFISTRTPEGEHVAIAICAGYDAAALYRLIAGSTLLLGLPIPFKEKL